MKGLAYLKALATGTAHKCTAPRYASACQSSVCPDPVRFPALSQIKPHAPRVLVVPFRQFLQVSHLRAYYPRRGMSQTFLQEAHA